MVRRRCRWLAWGALALGGCVGVIGDGDGRGTGSVVPAVAPAEPMMVRLTGPQLYNTYLALLGEPLELPTLPQDDQLYGFTSLSAATKTIAPVEAEQYEAAAYAALDSIWVDASRLDALVGCDTIAITDDCVQAFVADFAARAWRRPVTTEEIDDVVAVGLEAADKMDAPSQGTKYALAVVLQSPHFLFRVAIGEPSSSGGPSSGGWLRFTSWEMASRLSYLITDAPPDAALRAAAEADELVDEAIGFRVDADGAFVLDGSPFADTGLRCGGLVDVECSTRTGRGIVHRVDLAHHAGDLLYTLPRSIQRSRTHAPGFGKDLTVASPPFIPPVRFEVAQARNSSSLDPLVSKNNSLFEAA